MRGHVLIVDDNPIDLKLAAELLKAHGYAVDGAADAEEAQRLLLHQVPDLIVTDIALPGMDGLTFTRKLKADDRLKHVPVVALTAFAMRGDAEELAAAAGCRSYIVKPVDVRRFAEQISEILHPTG
jgi:CheY-like chemotaxis protein